MEKKLEELKKNLYDTIRTIDHSLDLTINGFEVIAVNMKKVTAKSLLRVVVYKNDVEAFRKEYDINGKKIKTGPFSKPKLCEFDIQVIDTIMEDLTRIVAISEWREQKLKKLGI
jgi:hypothetical protein